MRLTDTTLTESTATLLRFSLFSFHTFPRCSSGNALNWWHTAALALLDRGGLRPRRKRSCSGHFDDRALGPVPTRKIKKRRVYMRHFSERSDGGRYFHISNR